MAEIKLGYLSIDNSGRIWRNRTYFGKNNRKLASPKRAEYFSPVKYLILKKGLYNNGRRKTITVRAHRIVYMFFYGDIDSNLVINHIDANPRNNNPQNLETVTVFQNMKHAKDMNLIAPHCLRGEDNKNSKLTESEVIEIRKIRKNTNMSYQKIADLFNVSKRNIVCIDKRITWNHI